MYSLGTSENNCVRLETTGYDSDAVGYTRMHPNPITYHAMRPSPNTQVKFTHEPQRQSPVNHSPIPQLVCTHRVHLHPEGIIFTSHEHADSILTNHVNVTQCKPMNVTHHELMRIRTHERHRPTRRERHTTWIGDDMTDTSHRQ